MTKDEALDLALEFFETMQRYKGVRSNIFIKFEPTATGDYFNLQEFDERAKPIITAIKQALAAPAQEPVGKVIASVPHLRSISVELLPEAPVPSEDSLIYTTPPAAQPAVPLTDEQIQEVAFTAVSDNWDWLRFARAIEAAHGITEKGQP